MLIRDNFLDRCRFPSAAPKIALFDLNPHSLAKSAKRLRQYNPTCYLGNALHRIDIDVSGFDSISLNYLLHCLPGDLASKSIVFENVKPLLRDGGVIFGSTILGESVRHNLLAKQLMKMYSSKAISSNLSDWQSDLEAGLKAHFDEHTIHIAGCVALFSARKRMARTVTGARRAVSAEVPRKIHDGLASLWTEMCLAMPAIQAQGEEFEVYVVTDASGESRQKRDMAIAGWFRLALCLSPEWLS
jgi:hypothetical protein